MAFCIASALMTVANIPIESALARIEDGSFGECQNCGEAIAPKRLQIDPTAPVCIDCAS